MSSVFISHSWSDKPLARKLADTIRRFEIRVWLDEAEIKLGDSLIEKIRSGIDSVEYVIALLSNQAVASEWVKRELEIAMNQEIEGKRVKVLPILAESCSLPGFLKGKLYADMSSPKRFKQALPMLLDRLGVSSSTLSHLLGGKSVDEVTEQSSRAIRVANALQSNDPNLTYKTLKSLKEYKHRELLLHPQVLEALVSLLQPDQASHVRLECLRVLEMTRDSNLSEKLEIYVEDENLAIAERTIKALATLKASSVAFQMLNILRDQQKLRLHKVCIDYFTKVKIEDDADAISVVFLVKDWAERHAADPGVALRVARVLCTQWGGNKDDILDALLCYLESPISAIRLAVLEAIKNYATEEELWIRRTELKIRVVAAIKANFAKGVSTETAIAWLIGFLWYEIDREDVWKSICEGSEEALRILLDEIEIEGYYLDTFFDGESDVAFIINLIKRSQGEIRVKLLEVLTELPTEDALKAIVEYNYQPSGWRSVSVLVAFSKLEKWNEELNPLLDFALADLPDESEAQGFALLAQVSAGRITLPVLLQRFPRKDFSGYGRHMYDLQQSIERLLEGATPDQKRHLKKLLSNIRKSIDKDNDEESDDFPDDI